MPHERMGSSTLDKFAFGVEPATRHYALRLARYEALGEVVASYVRRVSEERGSSIRLLDVGVGKGRSYRYLEARKVCEYVRFCGLDVSLVRLATVHMAERWNLMRADLTMGIPLADQSFDVVICEQVLEHLRNPLFVLREIGRVLRPGGLLVLGVPILPLRCDALVNSFVSLYNSLFGIKLGHGRVFSSGSIARAVRESGDFDLLEVRGFRFISGWLVSPLEDFRWWYRLNRFLGRHIPSMSVEVQIVARRLDRPHRHLRTSRHYPVGRRSGELQPAACAGAVSCLNGQQVSRRDRKLAEAPVRRAETRDWR